MTIEALKQAICADTGVSVSKLVYDFLTEEIVQMRIAPGEMINEVKFSSALEISRSPIRTALDQLEANGLIRQEKGRRAQVTELTQSEYYLLSELRMAVEGQAAYSLAYTVTAEEVRTLGRLLKEVSLLHKAQLPYPQNDTNFHEYIIRATQNNFLYSAYELYRLKLIRYRIYTYQKIKLDSYGRRMRNGIHAAIYNAIRLHNAEAARNAALEDAALMRTSTNLFV